MAPSLPQLLIILVIVLLLFGAKRLRNLGGDLGAAVKGFKSAVKDGKDDDTAEGATPNAADTAAGQGDAAGDAAKAEAAPADPAKPQDKA